MHESQYLEGRLIVKTGDITDEHVDTIVNAANSTLLGGGGVDGAIHAKGGPEILRQCREIRRTSFPEGLPTGAAVITDGGLLRAKHVIHTVGPIYGSHNGHEAALLAASYINSLALAMQHDLRSVSFPSISTGAYGYPKQEAAQIVGKALRTFVEMETDPEEIRLVFFHRSDADIFLLNCGL